MKRVFIALFLIASFPAFSQGVGLGRRFQSTNPKTEDKIVDYEKPKEYTIANINVTGTKFLDPNTLISVSGLNVNDKVKIPGEKISTSIKRLMEQGILEEASVNIEKIEGEKVYLELNLKERPRLNKLSFYGVRKGEIETLEEKIKTYKGKVITESLVKNLQNLIKKHYRDKGFYNCTVQAKQITDSVRANNATIHFSIKKSKKVRIQEIEIEGIKEMPQWRVLSKMKGTRVKAPIRVFSPSKFIEKKYTEDKENVVKFLNKHGYRNAQIISDSIVKVDDKNVKIVMKVNEGNRFYYRNITWSGNYLRNTDTLNLVLGVKKGDLYNPEDLDKRINGKPQADVSSYYMDDGYLYFSCIPIEKAIIGDSIDVEMRITEGKQATISKIILNGNTKTSDHVVMREILTKPGQKFSKTDLIETVQMLSKLGYFDPQKIDPKPVPQNDGNVNIEFNVEEKSNDNIELSGGWSQIQGIIGTFGVVFNNFSARKMLKLREYKPLPKGDGQKLALRLQANGGFQSYSISFTEPWLGGKKPNSFSFSIFQSTQDYFNYFKRLERQSGLPEGYYTDQPGYSGRFNNSGVSVGFGKRLQWPDRDFSLNTTLSYQFYNVKDSYLIPNFTNGKAHDLSLGVTLSRYSLDNPQFTRSGSNISLSGTFNPPYTALNIKNSSKLLIEGHKWMFDADWYVPVVGKLIFHAKGNMGFVGRYNSGVEYNPFGRFSLGGAGMGLQNNNSIGVELIGLRGYDEGVVYTPTSNERDVVSGNSINSGTRNGGIIYSKYTAELRYPVSLNPQATIYVLSFAEAGNSWGSYKDYNPFKLKRSAGVGARVFMAAFGLLGIDYGYAFDKIGIPGLENFGRKALTFSIGQQIR
ncbi:MAG: outer membrane protein assembly factor BamA [Leadbetterella sp.]